MAKRRKRRNNRDLSYDHTRQREKSIFHRDNDLLSVEKNLKKDIDKYRANDYIRDRTPQKEIRHDLRHLTKNHYIRKNPLRYGPKDKVARLYLLNRTKDGKPYKTAPRQGFRDAKRVEVCQRRAKRRETLFRLGKAGKGRRIRTKKRYNEYSHLRC